MITRANLANQLGVKLDKVEQIGCKQLFIVNFLKYRLYFSYLTCVAIERTLGNYIYITTEKFSKTTTTHINLLVKLAKVARREVNFLDRCIFDDLYDGIAIE